MDSPSKLFQDLADQAVELAKRQGVTLDYSNQSIVELEKLLDTMYKQTQNAEIPEQKYQDFANVFGAYLGTTLIKNLGRGTWEKEPKTNAWAVKLDTYTFFPAKVYRRLKNGEAENVVFLYQETYNKNSPEKISLGVFQSG